MRILAIDPGSSKSGWTLYESERTTAPVGPFGIDPNEQVLTDLRVLRVPTVDAVVIEFMSPRGMPTSAQEMEALWWAGQFAEAAHHVRVARVTRDEVKYRLCGRRTKVNDANVRAALIDRFGGVGGKEAAVGRKAAPGPLYKVSDDVWAALALAVVFADMEAEG